MSLALLNTYVGTELDLEKRVEMRHALSPLSLEGLYSRKGTQEMQHAPGSHLGDEWELSIRRQQRRAEGP